MKNYIYSIIFAAFCIIKLNCGAQTVEIGEGSPVPFLTENEKAIFPITIGFETKLIILNNVFQTENGSIYQIMWREGNEIKSFYLLLNRYNNIIDVLDEGEIEDLTFS